MAVDGVTEEDLHAIFHNNLRRPDLKPELRQYLVDMLIDFLRKDRFHVLLAEEPDSVALDRMMTSDAAHASYRNLVDSGDTYLFFLGLNPGYLSKARKGGLGLPYYWDMAKTAYGYAISRGVELDRISADVSPDMSTLYGVSANLGTLARALFEMKVRMNNANIVLPPAVLDEVQAAFYLGEAISLERIGAERPDLRIV